MKLFSSSEAIIEHDHPLPQEISDFVFGRGFPNFSFEDSGSPLLLSGFGDNDGPRSSSDLNRASLSKRLISIPSKVPGLSHRYIQPVSPPITDDEEALRIKLYESRAAAKLFVSKVAMHIDDSMRRAIFRKIDRLLSIEDWDEEDPIPSNSSFETFVRLLLKVRCKNMPGLGATSHGTLTASWTVGQHRLTIECCDADRLRLLINRSVKGKPMISAVSCETDQMSVVTREQNLGEWFDNELG